MEVLAGGAVAVAVAAVAALIAVLLDRASCRQESKRWQVRR